MSTFDEMPNIFRRRLRFNLDLWMLGGIIIGLVLIAGSFCAGFFFGTRPDPEPEVVTYWCDVRAGETVCALPGEVSMRNNPRAPDAAR